MTSVPIIFSYTFRILNAWPEEPADTADSNRTNRSIKTMRDITGGQTLPSKPSFDILVLPDKSTRTESCASLQTQSTLTGAHDESTSNDKPALLGSQASVQTSSTLIDNHIRVDRAQNHDTSNRAAVMSSSKMVAKQADDNQPLAHTSTNSNRDSSRPSTGQSSQSGQDKGSKRAGRHLGSHLSPALQKPSSPAANG